jgi:hypothetical protein
MIISKKNFLLLLLGFSMILSGGCATVNPGNPHYVESIPNIIVLKDHVKTLDIRVKLNQFTAEQGIIGPVTRNCRLVGPIDPTPGKSIPQFIRDAFESELYEVGIYASDAEVVIDGNLDGFGLNTLSGYWDISMTFSSNKSDGFQVSTRYEFSSSYIAYHACLNAANAFTPAVQKLLGEVVRHPNFRELLGYSPR